MGKRKRIYVEMKTDLMGCVLKRIFQSLEWARNETLISLPHMED